MKIKCQTVAVSLRQLLVPLETIVGPRREQLKKAHDLDISPSLTSHSNSYDAEDVIDDDASVKNSLSSSRPVAKPRSSRSATLVNSPHQSNSDLKQGNHPQGLMILSRIPFP
ncbi:hypothetical protein Btru_070990 [Bulinus truncatus]|nr:hypothetical protein Btru_070990 [Bulinus truncatus]